MSTGRTRSREQGGGGGGRRGGMAVGTMAGAVTEAGVTVGEVDVEVIGGKHSPRVPRVKNGIF